MREPMYESFAQAYARHAEDSPYNAYYDRPAAFMLLGDISGMTVLDAACGPGLYASELLRRGAQRVIGFDQSPTMVKLTRERTGGNADVRVHDLAEPLHWLDDASIDVAVVALAINYIDNRVEALTELRRVLKRDGALVISTTHPTSDWLRHDDSYFTIAQVAETLRPGHDWPIRAWRRPLTVVCEEFRAAGFLIDRLVEPRPQPEMAEQYPEDFARLEDAPAFITFRLVPDPRS